MNDVVVIKVGKNVFLGQVTIVVISVHLLSHGLVEARIKETQRFSTEIWSLVHHEYKPAHVAKGKHDQNAIDALIPLAEAVLGVSFQIAESTEEGYDSVDTAPDIG